MALVLILTCSRPTSANTMNKVEKSCKIEKVLVQIYLRTKGTFYVKKLALLQT